MNLARIIAILSISVAVGMPVSAETAAEPDSASESSDAAETAETPVLLLAGMTVDAMLKSVNAPSRETYRGVVADIITGDMLIMERNGATMKVRLYGVDCPEPGQPFHEEAKQYVSEKFKGQTVNVSVFAIDSQQNPVALVFNTNGESLSHLLVAEGMGWWDRRNASKDALLRRLNAEAITNGVGLYSDATALAPWDYRDSRGMAQFTYTLVEENAPQPPPARAPEKPAQQETRSISAKGTMTENLPRRQVSIPKGVEKDINVMDLMGKHQPYIAEDDAGNPLGLTATNISQIPFAAEFGLRDGDIISNVNGIPVQSIPQIMQMAPQFEGVKQFNVEIIRNGQRTTIPITIN